MTAVIMRGAPCGTTVNNGTDLTYEPAPGFSGNDFFTYTITDGNGEFSAWSTSR